MTEQSFFIDQNTLTLLQIGNTQFMESAQIDMLNLWNSLNSTIKNELIKQISTSDPVVMTLTFETAKEIKYEDIPKLLSGGHFAYKIVNNTIQPYTQFMNMDTEESYIYKGVYQSSQGVGSLDRSYIIDSNSLDLLLMNNSQFMNSAQKDLLNLWNSLNDVQKEIVKMRLNIQHEIVIMTLAFDVVKVVDRNQVTKLPDPQNIGFKEVNTEIDPYTQLRNAVTGQGYLYKGLYY